MDFLRDSAFCLITAAAVGTLVTVLVPRGAMDKTVRAVIGIFVVAVICSPISEVGKSDLAVDAFVDFKENDFDKFYTEDMNGALINTFRTALGYKLNEFADELDFEILTVDSDVSVDDERCINIQNIAITIGRSELYNAEELSRMISEKLGLPVDVSEE